MEFREWFNLKSRESFTIDPQINPGDARFYFGRAEIEKRIKAQLRRSFIVPGTPKMVIWGPYGSGKTQTLYHLEYYLLNDKPASCKLTPKTVYLDLEMQSKSECSDWHLQILERLGRETVVNWVNKLFNRVEDLDRELQELFGDQNMVEAVKNLRAGGDISFTAWRWLTGQKLTAKEQENLKVTRTLGQIGASDMVKVLVGIGKLAERNGEQIIFFMDEAEQFRNVSAGDAAQSLHQYLRKLAEPANSTVGFIIGSFAEVSLDDMPELLIRQDIRSRIGELNYVEMLSLPAVQEVKAFIEELLTEFTERDKVQELIQTKNLDATLESYPFTPDSLDLLCQYASQDPTKALPRHIIRALNECAIQAWDEQKTLVDEEIVNAVAPLVFG